MGFKSKLKIGNSNPSKKINQAQKQRTQFDKHEDDSYCIQADQMQLKNIIDLSEVKCQGFDKIIYAKKGWQPQTTRMVTIVCCPSTRTRVEKALVRRFEDRESALRRGVRESDLWTEKQKIHSREINEDWQHFDLIPGKHVNEETLEIVMSQIEEVQFMFQKDRHLILPPMIMNDKGIRQVEKYIGSTNWKLDNSRYWRIIDDISNIIIPICCQSSVKNCQNWIVVMIERGTKQMEVYDTRRQIGSMAIIQRQLKSINQVTKETIGMEYKIEKVVSKMETNQVNDPEDCGLLAILITNHLALELEGEPVFQIFSKDWLSMQRYYLMLNLEVGFMKMEIGKSGYLIREEEAVQNQEKRSEMIWSQVGREIGDLQESVNQQLDNWEGIFQRSDWQLELEQEFEHQEEAGSDFDGHLTELECCLFSDGSELQQNRDALQMAVEDSEKKADINRKTVQIKPGKTVKQDGTEKQLQKDGPRDEH
ncbi:hypothetical protein OXYTRIMIC_214 [Oxytricha trifallax]|uniref:Ubiquitin-like protease family profile domain-containing protein n=1 Tax=Oxytricha trifallax TaxID=1172189 RepID=A0A073HYK7_9SPIT|nr:hypothetical protein OXYTRIMIC_214 [Oxytricha trifallax]